MEYLEIEGFTNLKDRVSFRDKAIDYHYRDREIGECVNVTVGYTKGGTNYLSGNKIPRGIYVRLSETTIEKSEGGFTMESFTIGLSRHARDKWGARSGSHMVKLLARGNPKLLKKIASELDRFVPEIADLYRYGWEDEMKSYFVDLAQFAAAA